jgi:hypothetical protein
MFNFDQLKADAASIVNAGIPHIICLAGVRGAGKSSCLGTLPTDKKTLIVQCTSESHSFLAAKTIAQQKYGNYKHLIPYNLDMENGTPIYGDKVYGRLIALLNDTETPKHFDVICLDSIGALDTHVQNCTEVTQASKYDASKTVINLYNRLFISIRRYISKGGIFIYTLPIDIYSEDNRQVATPRIRGTGVVTSILGETPIITIVAQDIDHEESNTRKYYFTFDGSISKSKKKITAIDKTEIKTVPLIINCNCRITGVPSSKIPSNMPADLSDLFTLLK